MKNRYVLFRLFLLLFAAATLFAQDYQFKYINKSPMYATASILQDYDEDGDMDIIVTRRSATNDPDPSSVEILENDGTGLFPKSTLFSELESPTDITPGDFNNDNRIDYLISDENQLLLLVKQSDGSYESVLIDSIQTDQSAAADFNNDGYLDIVSVGFGLDSVNIYLNNDLISFVPKLIAADVSQVDLVETADLDSDNDMDIVIGSDFRILYNDGNAGFDSTKILYTTNGDYSSSKRGLTITDLNNDNILDILTFSGVGFGGLYFLDGSKGYSPSLLDIDNIDLGGDLAVEDFDGNGLKDIVRQNIADDYLVIMYQNSDMVFSRDTLELFWDNKGSGKMSVGDLDDDGDPDLVFPENGNVDGDLSWFENIGGKLFRHTLYGEIKSINIIKTSDIDNDDDLDIIVLAGSENSNSAVSENEIIYYENIGQNNFLEHRIDDHILLPSDLAIIDLDKNGINEILATAQNGNKLLLYENNGIMWNEIVIDDDINTPTGLTVAEISADDHLDIIVSSFEDGMIYSYINNGFGEFTRQTIDDNILNPEKITADDLNGDGYTDLAVAASDSNNSVIFYRNLNNGSFQKTTLAVDQYGKCIQIGDWDGDGYSDIVASFNSGISTGNTLRDIAVFLNDGNATFTDSNLIEMTNNKEQTKTFDLVDIDNDSDLDILFAHTSKFYLAKQNGDAELTPVEFTSRNYDIYDIETADLNNDGDVDILVSDQFGSSSNLLLLSTDIGTDIQIIDNRNIPEKYILEQNYPNPFNPTTTIEYSIPTEVKSEKAEVRNVTLKVYDILGRVVATLLNEKQAPGNYNVTWNASSLPSGIYFYKLSADNYIETKKMMLLK